MNGPFPLTPFSLPLPGMLMSCLKPHLHLFFLSVLKVCLFVIV